MLEKCPTCETYLINGEDSKLQIEYTKENEQKFAAGEMSLAQLNETAKFFYMRPRLCPNSGNENAIIKEEMSYKYQNMDGNEALVLATKNGDTRPMNPPCPNYHGGNTSNPLKIVETIKIYDN